MKRLLIFLALSILFAAGAVGFALNRQYSLQNVVYPTSTPYPTVVPSPTASPAASSSPAATATPAASPASLQPTASIDVPYTLQAPFNVWDALHEETCEEASLVMVKHYLDGTPLGTPAQVDQELKDMVSWETDHGYGTSITLQQLNQIAIDYYGLKTGHVVSVSSYLDLKKELAAGHPIITGMAGKLLPNPYFSNGGPNYHMLVVKGYDATGFLTNEPGTYRGNGYHYDYGIFFTALHDWNAQNILQGAKEYLVFK